MVERQPAQARKALFDLRSGRGYFNACILMAAIFGVLAAASSAFPHVLASIVQATACILLVVGWHVLSQVRGQATGLPGLQAAPYVSLVAITALVDLWAANAGPPSDPDLLRWVALITAFACVPFIFAWPVAWVWLIAARRKGA